MPAIRPTSASRRSDCRPALNALRALALGALSLSAASTAAEAGDFALPGDEALRHHLQFLSDRHVIDELVTTWPQVPSDLQASLEQLDQAALEPSERWSLNKLSDQLRVEQDDGFRLYAQAGNSREELRGFSSEGREQGEVRVSLQQSAASLLGNLSLALVDDPLDGNDLRLDNSYVAVDWGQWRFGAGKIDRWWGPGWQSSLILSNNARPAPGVFVSRTRSEPSDLPLVKLLGPWHLTVFANQLESGRHIPDAKLLGTRLAIKPWKALEIGLSRTAQWGGEGRPESAGNLWKLILGQDNRGADGIGEDGSNEPGNQLGGIDWRWTPGLFDRSVTLYGQLIGEDEAGGLPSRHIGMLGIETPLVNNWSHGRLYFEASDTTMRFYDDPIANSAYEHSIYRSGYRYYGNPIGASTDNDSRLFTLGGFHEFNGPHALTWKAIYGSLNRDGVARGNRLAPHKIETAMLTIEYKRRLSGSSEVSVLAYGSTDSLAPETDFSKTGVQLRFSMRR